MNSDSNSIASLNVQSVKEIVGRLQPSHSFGVPVLAIYKEIYEVFKASKPILGLEDVWAAHK